MVVKPELRAAASATATTRSLNEWVGLPLSSLTHSGAHAERARQVVGPHQLGEARVEVGWSATSVGTGSRPR